MNIRQFLEEKVSQAMHVCGIPTHVPPMVRASARKEFGDYQVNGVMPAAKGMKLNPRELGARVIEALSWQDFAEKVELAGPGFINIHLKNDWLFGRVVESLLDARLGVPAATSPKTVVVDYSSVNLAKEMHVGHLRSTIIGDVISRLVEFAGHRVVRQNHVGDWGTQFGMLLAHLDDVKKATAASSLEMELSDLESFYIAAKKRFDSDTDFEKRARAKVVEFQSGDSKALSDLRFFIDVSLRHCEEVFERLHVLLKRSDVRGESAYNSDLPKIVNELREQGLLVLDDGAQCVFLDEFKGKEGEPLPIIVQKSDGGYLYMTTDLAALRYRSQTLGAHEILVVTDSRQALHFKQVEALGRRAGFLPQETALHNITFGMMNGPDGKPFRSRDGGNVKMVELLNEAEQRAYALVKGKNTDLSEAELRTIAKTVSVSAVKYADLSKHRSSDYVFSWDSMLSFEGNTAPYMLYAYTRIAGIFRKTADGSLDAFLKSVGGREVVNGHEPQERALVLVLSQFSEVLQSAVVENLPHYLCTYLYDLSGSFMSFYEACPVLNAPESERRSRLLIAALTAKTLQQGLSLLGIQTLEKM